MNANITQRLAPTEAAIDLDLGLSTKNKYVASKYLYDDHGSMLFQQIMHMPEYYPTDAEFEILAMQSGQIVDALAFDKPFNIVELGAGDGIKTRQLLKTLLAGNKEFTYIPVDISAQAIDDLKRNMQEALPQLKIAPLVGDYFSMMDQIAAMGLPSLFLFLGSNIGNYPDKAANVLLMHFNEAMNPGDKLLIGMDLQKNPGTIQLAYDDPHGITKAFNMNLLNRLNRELEANFQLSQFDFYCHYDPVSGEVRSYLVSLKDQKVYSQALDKYYNFKAHELIWTELSKKYTLTQIEDMADQNGFSVEKNFLDCKHYFADSLWVRL
ncbi:dimethylhistidine N-methyltransferase [Dyadobacter jejuensis]|uniref:Dimethylhistidine N-methyltransferase n=1 Tax=Dyadobacter jejuensis TaxID=1082580 RepID=A0A316B881_9BACT|nr:L-histidine N(alpha)-methyltransferase [Dyadobacter jejuensis]PWJ58797.1 dimethylhistidine N-methyltransferase [Dyadobacter jejuensis]